MDDTPEIRARLERITALSSSGADRPELLRAVRGLLEEGERSLRAATSQGGGDATPSRTVPAGGGPESAGPLRREETVS